MLASSRSLDCATPRVFLSIHESILFFSLAFITHFALVKIQIGMRKKRGHEKKNSA